MDAQAQAALVTAALSAVGRAYAPYSGVHVGAALLDDAGRIHTGSNVESASYGLTVCAERTALVSAVAQGVRRFVAVAVASDRKQALMACGACRQFLSEFGPAMRVLVVGPKGEYTEYGMDHLLPSAFCPDDLTNV